MNRAFNKIIKSNVLLSVLTVLAVVLLTTGVTYSLFVQEHKNTKNQTIAVGKLDTDITSITGAIVLNDIYPEKADKITEESKKYEFTLSNNGTFDLKYRIYLKDSTSELLNSTTEYSKYKKMNRNYNKYINYKLDGSLVPKNLESIRTEEDFVLIEGVIEAGKSEDHYLQFFLDNKDTTTEGAPNDITGSILSLDIYLDSSVANTAVDEIIRESKSSEPQESESGIFQRGTDYYFRGNASNNYVNFAGNYWRIINVSSDGSMRIAFDGTEAHENGTVLEDRVISTIAFNARNTDSSYDASDVKNALVEWFNNISEKDAIKGSIELLTKSDLEITNRGLNYKDDYLYRGISIWTSTPSGLIGNKKVYVLDANNSIVEANITDKIGVVPVITLNSEYTSKMVGTGIMSDPYRVINQA